MRLDARGWTVALLLAAAGTALADSAPAAMDIDGTTPLHWAVYRNETAEVERLLAKGADANASNDYGATPLSEAAVTGNVEVIRALLKAGARADATNADGQTPLMILARSSNVEAAQLLLKAGADVNRREQWRGQTALMWAAAEGQPEMVKLLVKHGAEVDARSAVNDWERQVTAEPRMQARPSGGFTPLLYAARRGCVDCTRHLLDAGANINLTDPDRVTPLLLATLNLNFDTAALLVKRGANVNKWDTWGRAPLYAAVDVNTVPTGGRADRPSDDRTTGTELIAMLLDAGANPDMQLKLFPPYRSLRDDRGADTMLTLGTTPLLRAAKAVDVPAIRLLLKHGARADLPNARGNTPLQAAAGVGHSGLDTRGRYRSEENAIEAARLLLDAGADVNARDSSGSTALHGAAALGWNALVTLLAERKADLFARDARGRTPVELTRGEAATSGRAAGTAPKPETEALLQRLMAAQPATGR
jgi:ankyrin repeat protein